MAEDTELKKLNKNVTDAVNILKSMYGNSAQVKAMNEKEREAINKWLHVVEGEEEVQKKQRAFTERVRDEHGRFIKKGDDQSKKFMGMAQSIKGMFGKVTKGIKNSLSNITKGIVSNLQGLFQSIKGHLVGLFGEESEWFDILSSIKDSIKGFFGWFIQAFVFLFKRSPAWASKMNKSLKDMYNLQIKQMKMEFLDASGKKKGGSNILLILGMIFVAIGAALGGWIKARLMAMTLLWKGLRITKILKSLRSAFNAKFTKIANFLAGKKGIVTKLWSVLKKLPILGKLIKGLAFGLKWLGWPIAMLIGVFDFIKGYAETDGSVWEKIKGGLWKAIEGFIQLPVTFIGWVVESIAGWFGVELNNVNKKIMDFIKYMFHLIIFGWEELGKLVWNEIIVNIPRWTKEIIGGIWNMITGVYNFFNQLPATLLVKIPEWTNKLMDGVDYIVTGLYNFFVNFWNMAIGWIQSKIPTWMPGSDILTQKLSNMTIDNEPQQKLDNMTIAKNEPQQSVTETANNLTRYKINDQHKRDSKIDDLKDSINNTGKETAKAFSYMAYAPSIPGGGGGMVADTKQVPDELDNYAVGFQNYALGE